MNYVTKNNLYFSIKKQRFTEQIIKQHDFLSNFFKSFYHELADGYFYFLKNPCHDRKVSSKNLTLNPFPALIQRFYGDLLMAWHRIIKMKPKENFFFHFTIESYENLGLISTLAKENGYLILDCFTTMESASDFDRVINNVLKEMKVRNE